MGVLSALILIPVGGALVCTALGRISKDLPRWGALFTVLLEAVVLGGTVVLWSDAGQNGLLVESLGGEGSITIWSLLLDGLSLPLVVLTAVLAVVAVFTSWDTDRSPGAHHAMLLLLTAATIGVFLAADMLLFYVFWEAVLIPMFFLIGKWGHERRRQAAMKFFIYTFAGSAFMLVAILLLISAMRGDSSIAFATQVSLASAGGALEHPITQGMQTLIFWFLAAGFLVKIPAFPLHTWLPDAHVEAPTAGSIMLAGVLLKMGGYGLIRLALPLVPGGFATAAPVLAALGIIGIVYGAFTAMAQSDLKRLVAYSSVAHMGFVLLAISVGTPTALGAAMLGMISHGVVSGLLFLLVGLLYERTHTREIARFGGLMRTIPAWGMAFTFGALASLGLPGLSGFPGELLTVLEAFAAYGWWLVVVVVGLVVSASYHLWAVRRVNHGEERPEWSGMSDLNLRERVTMAPLILGIVAIGVWPRLVLMVTDEVVQLVSYIAGGG